MPPINVLVALADPTRCRIIEILRDGPQPVHTLAGSFKISRPAISRHLRVLKQARLISEKKSGRENRYALHPTKLRPVADWLAEITPPSKTAVVESEAAPVIATEVPVVAPEPIAEPTPAVAAPADKKSKAPRAPKPTPSAEQVPAAPKAVSQMGFDF
ncbi:metalloregulator ArsR/SmtB family transcription factor [Devosia sp. 2618]|uniref:ArsR/SmtB family transcription factor n=1 Tax=Devosia sp. 2618 TaxID=3156454 RepID=UPI003399A83C